MKYTQSNLDKLGDILRESEYVVRAWNFSEWLVFIRSQKNCGLK